VDGIKIADMAAGIKAEGQAWMNPNEKSITLHAKCCNLTNWH
jgi:hypothetical protein